MKVVDLLPVIESKTSDGKLAWEELGAGVLTVELHRSYSLELRKQGQTLTLSVLNEEGRRLDTVECSLVSEDNEAAKPMRRLYELARRQALDVDSALDDVRRTLERL